ncbi:MAG TPA: ATP-binding protein [Mycobacteriales bacterium]|jgi:signal transduction histidine kinase|nr:ATP-binding protein [Mycobacteriales bacterium]
MTTTGERTSVGLDRARLLAECGRDLFCLLDDAGGVTAAVGPWTAVTGTAAEEVEGQPLAAVLAEEDRAAVAAAHAEVTAGGPGGTVEARLAAPAAAERVFEIALRPLAPGETAASLRDVTAQRAVELELRRSNEELQRFAYVASHDLSEPLRMVTSYCALLVGEYADQLDENAREYLGFAADGATRMRTLIDDLLDYSRVGWEAGPATPVPLDEVFAEAVQDLRPAIAAAGADVALAPLPVVRGDRAQLRRVAANLLANALKFRAEGRRPLVAVSAERTGARVTVSVADNGIGIAEQHRERVFVMFKRLHGRAAYPGNGIGLALCKRIVELHGGTVWAEAAPDDGSVFRFTLAAAPDVVAVPA